MQDSIKPVLIMTWGNPSRGDDALGPLVHDALVEEMLPDIDILTDFQLQIEHTLDLENRDRILFVDASVSAAAPFEFYRLRPVADDSYTTHAMSPESLLAVYERTTGEMSPASFMLSIRGYHFDLGSPVSERARGNLDAALLFVRRLVRQVAPASWDALINTASTVMR